MRDIIFTLEEAELRRALMDEYAPMGLRLVGLRADSENLVAVLAPLGSEGPRLEARLADTSLLEAVARRATRVTCMHVTSATRVGTFDLRVEAQLLPGDQCPTCGQRIGQPEDAHVATPSVLAPVRRESTLIASVRGIDPTPSEMVLRAGSMGRIIPIPVGRGVSMRDHEVVTEQLLRPEVVGKTDQMEILEVDIPPEMEIQRD